MSLPTSGSISFAQIAGEYGLSLPLTLPNDLYGKTNMPTSGDITVPGDLYGKANVLFTPDGGNKSISGIGNKSITLSCAAGAIWTYTGGDIGGTVNVASGGSATDIRFSVTQPTNGSRTISWNVTGVSGGITRNFTVTITARRNTGSDGGNTL